MVRQRRNRFAGGDVVFAQNKDRLDTLPERWAIALRLRYELGLTFAQIAVQLGVGTERACQLVYKALRRLDPDWET